MNRIKRVTIIFFSILSTSLLGETDEVREVGESYDSDLEGFELVDTKTMGVKKEKVERTDRSRLYLNQGGAIWVNRNTSRIEADMRVTVGREAVVKDRMIQGGLSFSVQTNYGSYVKKWQLEVYRGDDVNLVAPLKVIKGEELYNNLNITWAPEEGIDYTPKAGNQLLFRFKAWDSDENVDITSTGVVDLVREDKSFDIEDVTEDDEDVIYGESTLMVHNIPVNSGMVRFTGNNLDGVDSVEIGEDSYDVEDGSIMVEEYYPTGEYTIPLTVIYKDGRREEHELDAEIPERYFIQTGMVDLYIGRNYVSKNSEVLEVDDEYEGDVYDKGRIAYFGMGKINDKLRFTAQVDTEERELKDIYKDFFDSRDDSIFDKIEDVDERFYPTYGDDSYIRNEVDTQGKLYLSVDYDKSNATWGNYNTGFTGSEFSRYDRSLYGAKVDYRTRAVTKYGDDRLNVVGFTSKPEILSAHDEFLGTGGSLYFLKHGDVAEGSEKVAIKMVDETTGITEDIVYLEEGRDYRIDDYQGRIILTRPLKDIASTEFSGVIKDDVRDGFENYLVVDYEYIPEDEIDPDNLTYGGKFDGWINDYVGIGATHVQEEKDGMDYKMSGGELTLRASEGTYLKGEFSTSEGTQTDSNFVSFDGGLSFDEISNDTEDRDGNAYRLFGVLNLNDVSSKYFGAYGNEIRAWYQKKDGDYSYADQDDNLDKETYGIEMRYRKSNEFQLKGGYQSNEEYDENEEVVTDNEEVYLGGEYSLREDLILSVEGKYTEELDDDDNELGKATLVGAGLEYEFREGDTVYIAAQNTVTSNDEYEDNDLYTIGTDLALTEKLDLTAEASTGERGSAIETDLTYSVNDDHDIYVGYITESLVEGSKDSVVFGQRRSLTDKIDVYQENQYVDDKNGKGKTQSYGADYERTEDHTIGATFQLGELDKPDEADVDRVAVSVYQKIELDKTTIKNKVEYRNDDGDEDIYQVLTTNSFTHKITDEYRLAGKFNYSRTYNDTLDKEESEFVEANIGLAYRPIYNDRFNFLSRYTFLLDEEDDDTERDISYSDEHSHIVEFEGLYSYNPRLDLGFKFAYKNKEETYTRASGKDVKVRSNIYLFGIKTTYHILKKWDVFGEYHWKVDDEEDDVEQGAIVAVNRHITNNLKIGVGYNFSTFDDDLRYDDYDANGWFLNVVGKF